MPQLDPTWFTSQLFWLLVAFAALYLVLSRWALPRLQGVLEMRSHTLSSDLAAAERLTGQSEHARQDYERTLSDARLRSQQLFADALEAQKAKAEAAHQSFDDKIEGMLKEAHQRIDAKKQELIAALAPASTDLANMIVEKLTKPSAGDMQSVVKDALKARNG